MKTRVILLLTICLSAIGVNAQTSEAVKVPAEVKPFVESGTKAIALESADLNGDNLKDYILVLERENPTKTDEFDYPEDQRPLLVLVRGTDKKLSEAKRNEQMIMCSMCGGVWGDPFEGITVGKNTFTVNHYGGSNWRWAANYKFNYSRIDKTWQLIRIEKTSFHTAEPNKVERIVMTPPKNFGKVDVADFNPEDYEEKVVEETDSTSDKLITENSAGKLKLGMTVAEARKALKGFTLERTSDGEGIALIGAREGGREYAMTFYAGEEDPEAKIDENAKIEMIEVWYSDYKTAEGVHPRMEIGEVEKKYGKVKEIMLSEIEAREFADFVNQPKGVQFRLMSEDGMAGAYKEGEWKTTKYTPNAYLFSIQVVGMNKFSEDSESGKDGKSNKTMDFSEFNQKIAKASAANESWVKFPTQVLANWLPKFEEFGSRKIEMASEFADVTDNLKIIVTDDNYADDSVRGEKYWVEIKKDSNDVWKIVSAKKAWVCRQNRGHQDYSIKPCL